MREREREQERGRKKLSVALDGGRIGYKTARERERERERELRMVWDQRRLRSGRQRERVD